uniref:VPS13_mid_rpt domain-containing protein n=1 Tax=Globodera pallida TaxID=36090 RepID=A0A183C1V3_GLOPA
MFKYHAPAVKSAVDFFKPPKSVCLHQLTTLAIARYVDVKAHSASALQHLVDERKKLKLEVKIDPFAAVDGLLGLRGSIPMKQQHGHSGMELNEQLQLVSAQLMNR